MDKNSYRHLVKSDLFSFEGRYGFKLRLINLFNSNRSFKHVFMWRIASVSNVFISIFPRYMQQYLTMKYQIQIPRKANVGAVSVIVKEVY